MNFLKMLRSSVVALPLLTVGAAAETEGLKPGEALDTDTFKSLCLTMVKDYNELAKGLELLQAPKLSVNPLSSDVTFAVWDQQNDLKIGMNLFCPPELAEHMSQAGYNKQIEILETKNPESLGGKINFHNPPAVNTLTLGN